MKHPPSPMDATPEAPPAMEAAPLATRPRASPAVGAQAQAATVGAVGALARSLSALVVEEVHPAAVGAPQAMAWEEDTVVAVEDQARKLLLAQVVEEVAHLDPVVEDPVVGLPVARS